MCHKRKKLTYTDPKIHVDTLGSCTGTPADPEDKPVQDADDLE